MPIRVASCGFAVLLLVVGVALLLGPAEARGAGSWAWPVEGEVITGYRNGGDPYAAGQHRGIDIAAPPGTPVVAAAAGVVRFRGVAGSNGLTVTIRTADGRYDTSYLHLSAAGVRKGQELGAGERIGAIGTGGGRSAQAPHLHFGVRLAGTRHDYVDPLGLLGAPRAPGPAEPPRDPVPVAAPLPVAPAPAPAASPVRVPASRRVPLGRRVRVPLVRPVRAPARRRVRAARPGSSLAPVGHGVPVPAGDSLRAPGGKTFGGREPGSKPAGEPAVGPDGGGVGSGVPGRLTPGGNAPRTAAPPGTRARGGAPAAGRGGPDVGWAIACVGLLLAAACLGRPGSGGGERRSGASAVRSWLKPLTGGR